MLRNVASASTMAQHVVRSSIEAVVQKRTEASEDDSAKQGKDKSWEEMSAEEQEAAQDIGYNAALWEAGEVTSTSSHPWMHLTALEQSAATVCAVAPSRTVPP